MGRGSDARTSSLIGETLTEFLNRKDVSCTFMDQAWAELDAEARGEFDDDGEDEDGRSLAHAENLLTSMAEDMERGMRKWCLQNNTQVPARLEEATQLRALAVMKTVSAGIVDGLPQAVERTAQELLLEIADLPLRDQTQKAYAALMEYVSSLPPGTGPEDDADDESDMDGGDVPAMELLAKTADLMRERLLAAVRRWCFEKAIIPLPRSRKASGWQSRLRRMASN